MLIPCPECEREASDRARACPHCGFPIAEEIGRALAEVTGHDRLRSARQRAAAGKLMHWSEGYSESEEGKPVRRRAVERGERFIDRHLKLLTFAVVAIIVLLQLTLLFSAVYN